MPPTTIRSAVPVTLVTVPTVVTVSIVPDAGLAVTVPSTVTTPVESLARVTRKAVASTPPPVTAPKSVLESIWSSTPLSVALKLISPIIKSFSGKVLGYKVRLRTKPDLESHIIAKLNKNDLLLVVGEEEDFSSSYLL